MLVSDLALADDPEAAILLLIAVIEAVAVDVVDELVEPCAIFRARQRDVGIGAIDDSHRDLQPQLPRVPLCARTRGVLGGGSVRDLLDVADVVIDAAEEVGALGEELQIAHAGSIEPHDVIAPIRVHICVKDARGLGA